MGFGTLDLCCEYPGFSAGRNHPYIPLLAVHPDFQRRGYGRSILRHLIAEAAFMAKQHQCQDILYLNVYIDSLKARALYEKSGFETIRSVPIADPEEGGRVFVVMAKRVGVDTG